MPFTKLLFFLTLALTCFFSCKDPDYSPMANDLCICMQPLADINDKIVKATQSNDTTMMKLLIVEIEKVSKKSEACAQKLDIKYGIVPTEDEPKAEAAFKKACPLIAEIISQ